MSCLIFVCVPTENILRTPDSTCRILLTQQVHVRVTFFFGISTLELYSNELVSNKLVRKGREGKFFVKGSENFEAT